MTKLFPSTSLTTGPAAAALIGTALGLLALGISHVLSEASTSFKNWMQTLGNLWMPGAQGIGPYSGKETLSVLGWLVSWVVLHQALKTRELALSRWLIAFLVGVALATTLIWPPVFEYFAGH